MMSLMKNELKNEKNLIMFESMLDQLLLNCKTCGSVCEIEKSNTGSTASVKATCCYNYTFHWTSQPQLHNKQAGNILIWKNNKYFRKCEHGRLSRRKEWKTKWLEDGSSAYVALEEVVLNKKFLKDIEKLTEFHHTGESLLFPSAQVRSKAFAFFLHRHDARTQLAVIDHNSNTGREQANVTRGKNKGQKSTSWFFQKGRKNGWQKR